MFPLPLDNLQQLRLKTDDSDVHASKNAGPAFYRCSPWLCFTCLRYLQPFSCSEKYYFHILTYSADTLLCIPVTSFALGRHAHRLVLKPCLS